MNNINGIEIPRSHPRLKSLLIRDRLITGFNNGLVAHQGLMAHGRGEAFDYLLGEKSMKHTKSAIKTASAILFLAKLPVISVNGNVAALCPKEIVRLSHIINAKIEVNLFYNTKKRKKAIADSLKKCGAKDILGIETKSRKYIENLDSMRRVVDENGIYKADVVLVPLEDGDRCIKLKQLGKTIITFDLNPFSRTSQTADVTIIDNIVRGITELINISQKISNKNDKYWRKIVNAFDNKKNIAMSVLQINNNLIKNIINYE